MNATPDRAEPDQAEPARTRLASVPLPGRTEPVVIAAPGWAPGYPPPTSRSVYAAAHVAATPDGEIDWDATLAFREHLWTYGFGVAEAMDTSQRGGALTWDQARDLITRSAARAANRSTRERERAAAAVAVPEGRQLPPWRPSRPRASAALAPEGKAGIVAGAGTDQLAEGPHSLADIVAAYREQVDVVRAAGAEVILMASRALAASTRAAEDYLDVYTSVIGHAGQPVMLHWLGPAFDPALRGYWGSDEFATAADTVVELIQRADGQVSGIKLSLLDAGKEITLRRRLPPGTRMFTGDDFNYADLIRGDGDRAAGDAIGHSDALLGAFAAITAPAAAALHALDDGDLAAYDAAIGPTVPLSRTLFEHPTSDYKAGVAFLAWLNGLQPHFAMLGQMQRRRSPAHLIRVFELAAAAGALTAPDIAADRMTEYLSRTGVT